MPLKISQWGHLGRPLSLWPVLVCDSSSSTTSVSSLDPPYLWLLTQLQAERRASEKDKDKTHKREFNILYVAYGSSHFHPQYSIREIIRHKHPRRHWNRVSTVAYSSLDKIAGKHDSPFPNVRVCDWFNNLYPTVLNVLQQIQEFVL